LSLSEQSKTQFISKADSLCKQSKENITKSTSDKFDKNKLCDNLDQDFDLKLDDRYNKVINTKINKREYKNKHDFPPNFFDALENKKNNLDKTKMLYDLYKNDSNIIKKIKRFLGKIR
jgi:hypothetical protein